jgi:hypothetical protein
MLIAASCCARCLSPSSSSRNIAEGDRPLLDPTARNSLQHRGLVSEA